jgi:hypothetical protein
MNEQETEEVYAKIEKCVEARIISLEKRLANRGVINSLKANWLPLLIMVGGFVASWFSLQENISLLQRDILEIKTNHLVHIQSSVDKEVLKNEQQDQQIVGILLKIEKLITVLERN